ncbi:hypothetical protein V3320_03005 [Mycoplasmopsis agalactiae]|uniref:MAG5620 family putative phospho-sugar mutase n=1 Tax=Mycoplasmopsis agalactiae TaxID=2110 RepID=UPI002F403424
MISDLNNKILMSITGNLLILKSTTKEQISEQTCSLVFEHICSILDNNSEQKILLSFQGDLKHYKIVKYIKNIPVKNFKVYSYDSHIGTDFSTDEIACHKHKIDYVVKFIISKTSKFISIVIYDYKTRFYVKKDILEKVHDSFCSNKKLESVDNDLNYEAELLNVDHLISAQASKEEILKAFFNVRPRYKSRSLVLVNNDYSLLLCSQLFSNYDTSFKVKKSKISNNKSRKFFDTFKNLLPKLKNYQSIIYIDNYSNLATDFLIDYKLKNLSLDQVVLLYLDFLVEELKRSNQVNIKKLFVVIPPNASSQIIELIKQYKMRYFYYNSDTIEELLNDENCLFTYSFEKINANPRYSKIHNNYYFLICLVWMLNIYRNRNNLLSFKYNSLKENFGSIHVIKKYKKIEFANLNNLVSIIENKYLESKLFNKIVIFKSWCENNYAILKLYSDNSKNSVSIYYDSEKENIVFEYHIFSEDLKQNVSWKFQYFKMALWINKVIKSLKS